MENAIFVSVSSFSRSVSVLWLRLPGRLRVFDIPSRMFSHLKTRYGQRSATFGELWKELGLERRGGQPHGQAPRLRRAGAARRRRR